MKVFDKLPKSIKKTLRYINQDVNSVEKLEEIQLTINHYISKRKQQLEGKKGL
ncbi:LytR family transcriptional regulator [Mesobacillus foraminis]|uniref:LytR family transcriptional regulator n=1 Tax=Mesobacillus foraminis TaxID=279826 RepID=UPI0039A0AD5A